MRFDSGLWGTLYNKSVKPKLEISNGTLKDNLLSFDVIRTEGADVYGSWLIHIELLDSQNNVVAHYSQETLASLPDRAIVNYYIAKIKPGKHSLIIPLGAKATLQLPHEALAKWQLHLKAYRC